MSRSGRPRNIKQLNPGVQPPLSKFITGSPRDSTESKSADSKKRRRSTGEKPIAKKRADSISDPSTLKKVPSELNTKDNECIVNKMSKINVQEANPSTNSPMLDKIMKMEARLTASIMTNRDKDNGN